MVFFTLKADTFLQNLLFGWLLKGFGGKLFPRISNIVAIKKKPNKTNSKGC